MSESCAVEVYENEYFHRIHGWQPHLETPYVMKANLTPCKPLDEITVPSVEWTWSTNWKIIKMPGVTDSEGWEYASRFSRFKNKNRAPKSEAVWSRARRRLWSRVMRREAVVKNLDVTKVTAKVQQGLTSIHQARVKIEEIMKQAPDAAESDQMRSLVTSVNRNIVDILAAIDQAEKQCSQHLQQQQEDERNKSNSFYANGSDSKKKNDGKNNESNSQNNNLAAAPAILKKLKNDVLKEQTAIERALDPLSYTAPSSSGSSGNIMINGSTGSGKHMAGSYRGSSFSGPSSISSSSFSGAAGSMGGRPPLKSSMSMSAKAGSMSDRRTFDAKDMSGQGHPWGGQNGGEAGTRKTEVKSGSAGAFNPSIFSGGNSNNGNNSGNSGNNRYNDGTGIRFGNDEPEDGVFVDRSTQDLLISQKLIPIDEVTVMQEIIDERHTEIEKIQKGLVEINSMFTELSKIVKEQEVEINTIYGNVDESHAKTKEAFAHIVEANRLHQAGSCVIS